MALSAAWRGIRVGVWEEDRDGGDLIAAWRLDLEPFAL